MRGELKEVERCLRRLAASDTPRKRRSARLAFQRAIRALAKRVDGAYRPLREDGSEIILVKRRGVSCPYCKVPFASRKVLLGHLRRKHGWQPRLKFATPACKCDACGKGFASDQKLIGHLAAFPDLGVHVASAALRQNAE